MWWQSVLRYGLLLGLLVWLWQSGATAALLTLAVLFIVRLEIGGAMHAQHKKRDELICRSLESAGGIVVG